MSLKYKMNIIEALKKSGYSTYRIRKDKIMSESTLQKIRQNEPISWENLNLICGLLSCDIGDIMEYVPDEEDE